MKRREFITLCGGAVIVWSRTARAQQSTMPVVGFVFGGWANTSARYVAAFRKGLNETGYVEGQNVTVEYHWLENQYGIEDLNLQPNGRGGFLHLRLIPSSSLANALANLSLSLICNFTGL
jgi:hypothetical protein